MQIFDNLFFIKENVKIEKIYDGYLCNYPYVVIKNIEELKTIVR